MYRLINLTTVEEEIYTCLASSSQADVQPFQQSPEQSDTMSNVEKVADSNVERVNSIDRAKEVSTSHHIHRSH